MGKRIVGLEYGSYTFDPANQQIIFQDLSPLSLSQILLITNITTNEVIYNFSDTNKGGNLTGGNSLQLDLDVSAMLSEHELMIFLDYPPKMESKTYNLVPNEVVTVGNMAVVFDSTEENIYGGEVDFLSVKVSHMGFDIEVIVDGNTSYRISLKELLLDHKLVDMQTRFRTNGEGTLFVDFPTTPIRFYKSLKVYAHNFYPWFGDGTVNGALIGGQFILS